MRRSLLFLLAFALAAPASAQVAGRAAATGSDTLFLNGQIYQLFGIDGVEFHQFCFVDGEPWACGASATRALQSLVDPVVVTCTPTGETNGDAIYAICSSDNGDLAALMVEQGWALANRDQSQDYVAIEEEARAAGNGIWRGASIEPWVYREDMAAIARRYAEGIAEPLRAAAEQALTAEDAPVGVFADVAVQTVGANDAGVTTSEAQVDVPGLGDDFFANAIPSRDVFSWGVVVAALDQWQRSTVASVRSSMVTAVLAELAERPSRIEEIEDADGYYAAMTAAAAAWIEAGRQPVLLVDDPATPRWVGDWLGGNPPRGAVVSQRSDITAANYLGTIDGIDVYVAQTPDTTSLLTVDDLVASLTFRRDGDNHVLQLANGAAADVMAFTYAVGIAWRDDPVVWIRFPAGEGNNPYAD